MSGEEGGERKGRIQAERDGKRRRVGGRTSEEEGGGRE